MPEAFWGSRCCKDPDGKKVEEVENTCTVRTSVPIGTPVHLVHVFSVHTLFFSNPHGTALFLQVKNKGDEICKVLSNSVFKLHGIKMVGIVNQVFGFVGYFTISTQIPRNRENGRCHS